MPTATAPYTNPASREPRGAQFRRIGVFQQLNAGDDEALQLAGKLAAAVSAEAFYCIHVRDAAVKHAPNPKLSELEARVSQHVPSEIAARAQVAVHQGVGVSAILATAEQYDLDLIIVGKRLPSDELNVGAAFTRLARKAQCSVMVVPDLVSPHFARFLAPVDFSPQSRFALETATNLARACPRGTPQVITQSVFAVSYGYSKLGCSLAEAGKRIEDVTREKMVRFTEGLDFTGIQTENYYTCSESTADAINQLAAVRKMDLIVLGGRSGSPTAIALLGKTTERVLMGATIPVLIVKDKSDAPGFFGTLLRG